MTDEKRFALLIDAENISAQYADYIMEEVEQYGVCSYKRIYGSWTGSCALNGKRRSIKTL